MLLRAIELVVRHHPSLPPVLDRVSIDLAGGELVAVVGSNGSGKSTLARALAGLLPLESGTISGPTARHPRIGLVLQDPAAQLVAVTVADEIALGPQHAGVPPAQVATVATTQIRAHDLAALWARDPTTLSGGQQQRVTTAAITACDVDVLVLDEPTALLDEPARREFQRHLRAFAGNRAVLWITQEPDEVAACDRVVVLDAGALVWSGSVQTWLAEPTLAATWGLDLPAPARIAHALVARGMQFPDHGIGARTSDALVAAILGGATRA